MDELATQQTELNNIIKQYNLTLNIDDYDERVLKQF
jgi:hypothetical protein